MHCIKLANYKLQNLQPYVWTDLPPHSPLLTFLITWNCSQPDRTIMNKSERQERELLYNFVGFLVGIFLGS